MASAFQAHHLQPQHSTTSFSALSLNSNLIRAYLDFDPFDPNEAKPPRSTTEPNQHQRQPPHTISAVDLQWDFEGFSVVCCWVLGLFLVVCTEGVLGLIFWVLGAIFLCLFLFFWYFLGIFSEVLGIFLCWLQWGSSWVFLVGFLCDCSRVLSGISGYFLDCSGERVGWDGERERKKLVWDGVTEEKWEREREREREKLIKNDSMLLQCGLKNESTL